MKVLVTGASGFVGQALSTSLQRQGHDVVRVVRHTSLSGEVAVADLSERTDWTRILESGFDAVLHCAARAHVMNDELASPLFEYRRVNVQGTVNLARQAAVAGVKRFVFISSVKVNGESTLPGQRFNPSDVPAPQDDYALSKHEAEQALWQVAYDTGMEVVCIRPPLVYGPGVKGNFARMVQWIRQGAPLPLGAVHNSRSLIALDNLVDLLALCANPERSPHAANQVFLVSDGDDVSTTELLRRVALAYGVPARLVPVPASWLLGAARVLGKTAVAERLLGSLQVDAAKAYERLGWRPPVSMNEQLQKMAQYDASI